MFLQKTYFYLFFIDLANNQSTRATFIYKCDLDDIRYNKSKVVFHRTCKAFVVFLCSKDVLIYYIHIGNQPDTTKAKQWLTIGSTSINITTLYIPYGYRISDWRNYNVMNKEQPDTTKTRQWLTIGSTSIYITTLHIPHGYRISE